MLLAVVVSHMEIFVHAENEPTNAQKARRDAVFLVGRDFFSTLPTILYQSVIIK